MRQGDHKDGAVCAAHRRPLTLMIGPIATNAYGLPSFGDEARTTVPRDASQRPPCRRKPPQTHPQERRWRGPRRTGATESELGHAERIRPRPAPRPRSSALGQSRRFTDVRRRSANPLIPSVKADIPKGQLGARSGHAGRVEVSGLCPHLRYRIGPGSARCGTSRLEGSSLSVQSASIAGGAG